jgi:hypothetical protein
MTELTNKYANSKIYKIICGNLTYYGSTYQPLSKRIAQHRSGYNQWLNGKGSNITSYKLFQIDDDKPCIYLVENLSCKNKEELNARERFHIENNDCVNKVIPGRTVNEYHTQYYDKNCNNIKEKKKQYREQNHVKIKERMKQYYEQNIDKAKEIATHYYHLNSDKIKEQARQYYEQNTDKAKERMKQYREQNGDKIKEQMKQYREKTKHHNTKIAAF